MKIGLRTIKTAVGATLALIIAQFLQLDYAISAGIIVILSVQNTKMDSFKLASQRFLSTVLALGISSALFALLGYQPYVFGLYLLLFIPVTAKLKVTDGIVVSSVLVTHLYIEQSIALHWQINELLLMFVGAGIGILMNLYMPTLEEKLIAEQRAIESLMQRILGQMAESLKGEAVYIDTDGLFPLLDQKLVEAEIMAEQQFNNVIFERAHYYVKYFDMRHLQFTILALMKQHLIHFDVTNEQSEQLAILVGNTAVCLDENNPVTELVRDVDHLLEVFRKSPLPQTREEFENRATLFQFLNDFHHLLEVKREFYAHLHLKEN